MVGPTKLKGYFPISALIQELSSLGLGEKETLYEIEELAKAQCIVSEDFKVDGFGASTLIKLAPSGFVHLDLLRDMDYWAAIAEDTNFGQQEAAARIAERIGDPTRHLSRDVAFENAIETLDYIIDQLSIVEQRSLSFIKEIRWFDTVKLKEIRDNLYNSAIKHGYGAWRRFLEEHKEGDQLTVTLAREAPFGFFADFSPGVSGLLHKSEFTQGQVHLHKGDSVKIEIRRIDTVQRRVHLSLVS
ncbi:S1 RNA-binding domain-containing protein [Brucella sp. 10RB9212]|uniref:S1 RNA-binding domain-containing protein n=1 Tax=unclassified Brucella TaxID=2632610 RepID=UPI00097297D8|nr:MULTISPECIES: S1 RNA-binding domain-containing protein [unclassified Brucella]APY13144.1 hypothetical protein BKD02_01470 [Brucella sp. 09RB8910]MRN46108.1 S1 RNA-binding domain-containing protein [Brucella sp. 10RB9212]